MAKISWRFCLQLWYCKKKLIARDCDAHERRVCWLFHSCTFDSCLTPFYSPQRKALVQKAYQATTQHSMAKSSRRFCLQLCDPVKIIIARDCDVWPLCVLSISFLNVWFLSEPLFTAHNWAIKGSSSESLPSYHVIAKFLRRFCLRLCDSVKILIPTSKLQLG